jgi:hypothetical protein
VLYFRFSVLREKDFSQLCVTVAAQKPGFISAPPCCYFLLPWLRRHLVSGAVRITHVAVTSLFPARQPYLPNYKTLSRQKKMSINSTYLFTISTQQTKACILQ